MAGAGDDKGSASADGEAGRKGSGNASGARVGERGRSLAARRRRIEMMRERQELLALLDDFGDGELDADLVLELADDDEDTRWVAYDPAALQDDEDVDLDEDDDFVDDEYPEEED